MLPYKFRRSASIAIPLISALAFFGMISSLFGVELTENIASSGITLSVIFAGLNVFALWLAVKHQVP